jgi:hypothetical protein
MSKILDTTVWYAIRIILVRLTSYITNIAQLGQLICFDACKASTEMNYLQTILI